MQLTRKDWIKAGLAKLAQDGIHSVRVEVIARELQISKGSFYHHFSNREELLLAMMNYWEDHATKKVIQSLEQGASPVKRLIRLLHISFTSDNQLETAFFAWAKEDLNVANRLAKIETLRTKYISKLYVEMDIPLSEANIRAEITYLMYLGWIDRLSRNPDLELEYHDIKKAIIRMLKN